MKIRKGFVSNSSSSSFVIVGENNIPKDIKILGYFSELTGKTRDNVSKYIESDKVADDQKVFITEFIGDCCNIEHPTGKNVYNYCDGGHGGPYCEDQFIELQNDVWIMKEHMDYPKRAEKALKAYQSIIDAGFCVEESDVGTIILIDAIDDYKRYKP